jgi:hypothetical protein
MGDLSKNLSEETFDSEEISSRTRGLAGASHNANGGVRRVNPIVHAYACFQRAEIMHRQELS